MHRACAAIIYQAVLYVIPWVGMTQISPLRNIIMSAISLSEVHSNSKRFFFRFELNSSLWPTYFKGHSDIHAFPSVFSHRVYSILMIIHVRLVGGERS